MSQPMTLLELRDTIAKAVADAIGHGMREKCERHADEVLKVVAPQLLATANDAALRQAAPVGVPAGWKLVPVEPTWDMRNEGRELLIDGLEKEPERLACVLWKAMLAAAPSAPQGFPECSGNPASCPENEGYGCCKPNPSAPQGVMTLELEQVVRFLLGEDDIDGHWFGEAPKGKGNYWWRHQLREAWQAHLAQPAPAVDVVAIQRVAAHIGNAADYIDKQYPTARQLDRGPIMRNMRRWHQLLTAALPKDSNGAEGA